MFGKTGSLASPVLALTVVAIWASGLPVVARHYTMVAVGDTAVVQAVAAAQHRLVRAEDIIGESDARPEVVFVARVVGDAVEGREAAGRRALSRGTADGRCLVVVAQTKLQCQAGRDLPVVLGEEAVVQVAKSNVVGP